MLFSKVDLFGNPDVSLPEVESSAEVLNSYGSAHVSSIKRGHRVSIYDLLVDNLSKPVARICWLTIYLNLFQSLSCAAKKFMNV